MARSIPVPPGVPVARFVPPPQVQVPDGAPVPLISANAPDGEKVQQCWVARVRVFHLDRDDERQAYEAVWQKVTDGHALVSETRVDFYQGAYVAFLRWVEFEYKLPSTTS